MHVEYLRGLVATGGIKGTRLLPVDFPITIRWMLVTPTPVVRRADTSVGIAACQKSKFETVKIAC